MGSRVKWSQVRHRISRGSLDSFAKGYEAARAAFVLGDRVRKARESRGLTQSDLAARMGTTQSVVARLEGGGVEPRFDTLRRVADALGADLVVGFATRHSGARRANARRAASRGAKRAAPSRMR